MMVCLHFLLMVLHPEVLPRSADSDKNDISISRADHPPRPPVPPMVEIVARKRPQTPFPVAPYFLTVTRCIAPSIGKVVPLNRMIGNNANPLRIRDLDWIFCGI
jgi:hypothetical protein